MRGVLLTALTGAVLALAAPAFAQGEPARVNGAFPYKAATQAAALKQGALEAAGMKWKCMGSTCTAGGQSATPTVEGCMELKAKAGRITAYGLPGRQLGMNDLAKCNGEPAPVLLQVPLAITKPLVTAPLIKAPAVKPSVVAPSVIKSGVTPIIKPEIVLSTKTSGEKPKAEPSSGEINVPELSFIGGAISSTAGASAATTIDVPELSFIGGAVSAGADAKPVTTTIAVPELSFVGQ